MWSFVDIFGHRDPLITEMYALLTSLVKQGVKQMSTVADLQQAVADVQAAQKAFFERQAVRDANLTSQIATLQTTVNDLTVAGGATQEVVDAATAALQTVIAALNADLTPPVTTPAPAANTP